MADRTLDPQVEALLAEMAALGQPPFEQMTVAQARVAGAAGFGAMQGDAPPGVSVAHGFLTGPTADLPVRVYTPAGEGPFPVVVYYHGSGWVILNVEVCDTTCRALAADTGCVVVAVNYQKAPEHAFPVAFDDAWAGLAWTVEHAEELNVDPTRVAVAGDSAGGNLAAAVAIKARDVGGPRLAFQLLIYPVTDRDLDTPSYHENAEGYLLQRETMRWFWGHYVDGATEEVDWRACPLRAPSLADLPPALVVTAEFDPLRDDGRRYAERLRESGVTVTHSDYAGLVHGCYWMQGVVDRVRDLHAEVARALRAALRPGG